VVCGTFGDRNIYISEWHEKWIDEKLMRGRNSFNDMWRRRGYSLWTFWIYYKNILVALIVPARERERGKHGSCWRIMEWNWWVELYIDVCKWLKKGASGSCGPSQGIGNPFACYYEGIFKIAGKRPNIYFRLRQRWNFIGFDPIIITYLIISLCTKWTQIYVILYIYKRLYQYTLLIFISFNPR